MRFRFAYTLLDIVWGKANARHLLSTLGAQWVALGVTTLATNFLLFFAGHLLFMFLWALCSITSRGRSAASFFSNLLGFLLFYWHVKAGFWPLIVLGAVLAAVVFFPAARLSQPLQARHVTWGWVLLSAQVATLMLMLEALDAADQNRQLFSGHIWEGYR